MKKFPLRLVSLLLIMILCTTGVAATSLVPGGQVIGLQLADDTVTVAGFSDPLGQAARDAGLAAGDKILRVDDVPVHTPQDVRDALTRSNGQVRLCVRRGQQTKVLQLKPNITSDGPRLGVYLQQGVTGLGTLTFIDPETGRYGALGHGVNSNDGGLLQFREGTAYRAGVQHIRKGAVGKPGQLLGALTEDRPLGSVAKNTAQGVFGKLESVPKAQPLPVADARQVHRGSATIRCTLEGKEPLEYSVEILKIYPTGADRTRNMLLHVTDQRLLQATGGIVQGMSGSPLVQDGKLIGAVTHVLVNDPTMGYGIFIENMLEAAG